MEGTVRFTHIGLDKRMGWPSQKEHMSDNIDYLKFYDSESYLINDVSEAFRKTGKLKPIDFMTMLIWKAERAKNYHKRRLAKLGGCTFAEAVSKLATGIYQSANHKQRLECLMGKWWFQLPTATAILTLLYPKDFTVFDWRVCGEVKIDYEPWYSKNFSDAVWDHYISFKKAVEEKGPQYLTLRDKDRFFIGRSNRRSIAEDCE
jgi:hypothetical protein